MKVAHHRPVVQVVDGKHFVPEFEQLLVAEVQLQLGVSLGEGVFVAAGGDVGQSHPRLHPALQLQVYVHVRRGPVVKHPHGLTAAADAVNATKTLDEPYRVPVDVVVEHGVAVL